MLGYAAASYMFFSGVTEVIEAAKKKDCSSRKSDGGG